MEDTSTIFNEIKSLVEQSATATKSEITEMGNKFAGLVDRLDAVEAKMNRPAPGTPDEKASALKAATVEYLKHGTIAPELKQLDGVLPADGGFTIYPELSQRIIDAVTQVSPIRQHADVVSIGTSQLDNISHDANIQSGWVAENAARPATNTGAFSRISISVCELYANPGISQRLLEDSEFDIESWLVNTVARAFAVDEGTAFVNGAAVGVPQGIVAPANGIARVNTAVPATITNADILSLIGQLPATFDNTAVMLMSKQMFFLLAGLVDDNNRPLYQGPIGPRIPFSIHGYPVVFTPDMPAAPAAGVDCILIGDIRETYKIVDRTDITILRDPFTNKPYTQFYTTKRVGGGVVNPQASLILQA